VVAAGWAQSPAAAHGGFVQRFDRLTVIAASALVLSVVSLNRYRHPARARPASDGAVEERRRSGMTTLALSPLRLRRPKCFTPAQSQLLPLGRRALRHSAISVHDRADFLTAQAMHWPR
jgi:hypothetical protein